MDQRRLFTPAPEVINLTMEWCYPDGWSVRVAVRRSGDDAWEVDGPYTALASAEAGDVASAVLESLLSGADAVAGSPPSR